MTLGICGYCGREGMDEECSGCGAPRRVEIPKKRGTRTFDEVREQIGLLPLGVIPLVTEIRSTF